MTETQDCHQLHALLVAAWRAELPSRPLTAREVITRVRRRPPDHPRMVGVMTLIGMIPPRRYPLTVQQLAMRLRRIYWSMESDAGWNLTPVAPARAMPGMAS